MTEIRTQIMKGLSVTVVTLLVATNLSGCGSTTKKGFTHPSYPVSSVKRIAILPFDGVAEANTAGDMISMVLANRGVFDAIVDRTQLNALITEHRLPEDLLNDETAIAKKQLINADALLKGRVTQFQQGRPAVPVATATKISMSLKLVSSETGQTIWTQLYAKSSAGYGVFAPNVDKMMIDMAEEVANDLAKLK